MVKPPGKVYLVGSGPGNIASLTVQARSLLEQAEVLVYDALVDAELIRLVPPDCLTLDVGKRGGQPSTPQAEINQLLARYCQQGKRVVRLKSGDPFIFGRSQAEMEALQTAGCSFEVVPGLSSALVAPLLAGIPLTDPVLSHCFAVLTAHDPDLQDWDALAQLETLVVLMGGRTLPEVIYRLQQHGRSLDTPIALIRWAGQPQQRIWDGTLADIVRKTAGESLAPCVMVIGEVVRLRQYYNPQRGIATSPAVTPEPLMSESCVSQDLPLCGKTILVTRSATQSGQFSDRLQQVGATVVEMPALEIAPPSDWAALDGAIAQISEFDWLSLSSANAVDFFLERLQALGKDVRALAGIKLAVVGEKTAQVLQQRGLTPDFVPPEFVADSLVAHFPDVLEGLRILFPRVESGGREVLVKEFSSRGAVVTEVAAYQSRCPAVIAPAALAALQHRTVDAITFASSKTVQHFCQLLNPVDPDWQDWLTGVCLASIGPQTSRTCLERLGRVDVEAQEYTLEGLTTALVDWFSHGCFPTDCIVTPENPERL